MTPFTKLVLWSIATMVLGMAVYQNVLYLRAFPEDAGRAMVFVACITAILIMATVIAFIVSYAAFAKVVIEAKEPWERQMGQDVLAIAILGMSAGVILTQWLVVPAIASMVLISLVFDSGKEDQARQWPPDDLL